MTSTHLSGAITTFLIHGAIAVLVLGFSDASGCGDDDGDQGKLKMTTIEAALAYKSKTQSRQPQKRRRRAKRSATKPQGVSRDETKKVEEPKKTKEPEPEEDFSKAFEKYKEQRQRDDDEELEDLDNEQEADKSGGQFDGSEHGFAEVSKGDPYMQELAKDMYASWELPTLEKGSGAAVGCVRLEPDGKVSDTKLETKSGNSNIDRSVNLALQKMQKQRNKKPTKVPRHLMEITTQWTCFKLNV